MALRWGPTVYTPLGRDKKKILCLLGYWIKSVQIIC